jgi:hypothetical protein
VRDDSEPREDRDVDLGVAEDAATIVATHQRAAADGRL